MLDIKFIRENQKLIEKNNKDRGVKLDLGRLLELDEKRRAQIHEIDLKRAELKKSSKVKPVPDEIKKLKKLGETIKKTESELAKTETQFKELLQKVPNLTHADAPVGGENDFKILKPRIMNSFSLILT